MAMTDEEKRELKNSVFAAKQAADQMGLPTTGIPVQSQQQAAQQAAGLAQIPVASVPLPSSGLVYEDEALRGATELEIRHMAAKDEDILMNQAYIKKGSTTTELVKSCLLNKSLDVGKLIGGDLSALLIAIRVTGYGADYGFKIKCPACETQQEHHVNLTELNIKELDLGKLKQVGEFQNAFEVEKLPVSGKRIVFKFLTTRDQERIVADIEAKRKKGFTQDNLVTTKLSNCIISVDGHTDRGQIHQFCQYMPAGDSLYLRNVIDRSEPGIDMRTEFKCSSCDHEEVITVPLGASFFWPDAE
jgi:hypothetical protein